MLSGAVYNYRFRFVLVFFLMQCWVSNCLWTLRIFSRSFVFRNSTMLRRFKTQSSSHEIIFICEWFLFFFIDIDCSDQWDSTSFFWQTSIGKGSEFQLDRIAHTQVIFIIIFVYSNKVKIILGTSLRFIVMKRILYYLFYELFEVVLSFGNRCTGRASSFCNHLSIITTFLVLQAFL